MVIQYSVWKEILFVSSPETVGGIFFCDWRTCDKCRSGTSQWVEVADCAVTFGGKYWVCDRHLLWSGILCFVEIASLFFSIFSIISFSHFDSGQLLIELRHGLLAFNLLLSTDQNSHAQLPFMFFEFCFALVAIPFLFQGLAIDP